MILPTNLPLELMQTRWATTLEPLLKNPVNKGRLVQNVVLTSGANSVSHGLGRPLVGWIVTRLSAAITIYDQQDTNGTPDLTLALQASGAATVDLFVF